MSTARNAFTGPWQGTSTDLLGMLTVHGGLRDPERGQWTPRGLSGRIERVQGPLAALGWQIWPGRDTHKDARVWNVVPPGWTYCQDGRWRFLRADGTWQEWAPPRPGRAARA